MRTHTPNSIYGELEVLQNTLYFASFTLLFTRFTVYHHSNQIAICIHYVL